MSHQLSLKKVRDKLKEESESKDKNKNKNKNKSLNEKEEHLLINSNEKGLNPEMFKSQSLINNKEIESVLMKSEYFIEIPPLEIEVEENGSNFSVGQRQLIWYDFKTLKLKK